MAIPAKGMNKIFTPLSKDRSTGNVITLSNVYYVDQSTGEDVSKIAGIYALAKKRKFKYVVFDDVQYLLLSIESNSKASGEFKDGRRIYAKIKQFTHGLLTTADMETKDITSIFIWQKLDNKNELVIPGEYFNNVIIVQGFFSVVLDANTSMTGEHVYHTNGFGLCKTPHGMFDKESIPNDIKPVLLAIEKYYN